MAVSNLLYARPGSAEKHTRIIGCALSAQMITPENGILRRIHVHNGYAGTVYLKLFNKSTAVAAADDDPDSEFRILNEDTDRDIDFDAVMGTFSEGMQVSVALQSGSSANGPAGDLVDVDVYWTET